MDLNELHADVADRLDRLNNRLDRVDDGLRKVQTDVVFIHGALGFLKWFVPTSAAIGGLVLAIVKLIM